MRAVLQIEYVKHAERQIYDSCADRCIKDWSSDDLSSQDKLCLSRCFDKQMTAYETFFDASIQLQNQRR